MLLQLLLLSTDDEARSPKTCHCTADVFSTTPETRYSPASSTHRSHRHSNPYAKDNFSRRAATPASASTYATVSGSSFAMARAARNDAVESRAHETSTLGSQEWFSREGAPYRAVPAPTPDAEAAIAAVIASAKESESRAGERDVDAADSRPPAPGRER